MPAPGEAKLSHGVGPSRTGIGEALGLLHIPSGYRLHVQPEALLRGEPIVELAKPVLFHLAAFLIFSTPSRASRRSASSSCSRILRSISMRRARVLSI